MMQPPRVVKNVAFRTHDSKNLMEAEVSGKKKGGAIFMSPRDMICTVTMDDDSSFRVYACVRGSVIEINKRLVDEPDLLGSDPLGGGYIAVMLPRISEKGSIGQACVEFDQASRNPIQPQATPNPIQPNPSFQTLTGESVGE